MSKQIMERRALIRLYERGKSMAWKKVPGLNGSVYVPESPPGRPRKHPCADCFSCQLCSDERCGVCREGREDCRQKSKVKSPKSKVLVPVVPKVR